MPAFSRHEVFLFCSDLPKQQQRTQRTSIVLSIENIVENLSTIHLVKEIKPRNNNNVR